MVVDGPLPNLAPLRPVRGDVDAPAFPPVLERAGTATCFAVDEFFPARISNPETRRACGRDRRQSDASALGGEIRYFQLPSRPGPENRARHRAEPANGPDQVMSSAFPTGNPCFAG